MTKPDESDTSNLKGGGRAAATRRIVAVRREIEDRLDAGNNTDPEEGEFRDDKIPDIDGRTLTPGAHRVKGKYY